MPDWANDVLDATGPAQSGGKVDFASDLMSPPAAKAGDDRPIGSGRDVGFMGSMVTGFSSDQEETVRFLAQELYPDEPLESAVKRFGTRDGVIFHQADDGKLYEALPSDVPSRMARGVGKSLPVGAGTAAGIATAPMATTGVGLAGTMAATAGAASAGEALRQKIGDILMGKASTEDLNLPEIATEAGMSGLGQGIGSGLSALTTRGAVRDISRFDPAATGQAYDEAARAGVDITPAEATGLPTLAAQQKRLTNITPTADKMREFLTERSRQVVNVWNSMLDDISGAADAETVGLRGRTAAQGALQDMRMALSRKAKPYYDAAWAKNVPYSVELEELLKRPSAADALRKAERLMADQGELSKAFFAQVGDDGTIAVSRVPDTKELHYVKLGLDDILGSSAARNEKTGGLNSLGHAVRGIKERLLGLMDEAVPEYGHARSIYAEGAEEVTSAMESALNILARTKDTQVLKAARHVFDPKTRSPAMVNRLRQVIEKKDPDAWAGLKRLYMQDVTTDALRIAESGDVLNPAGKLFKAFSNPRVKANLKAAMTPQEWQRMNDLLVVFRRASSVPALRSDTEFNRLMSEEATRQARPMLGKVLRAVNPTVWPKAVDDFLTSRSMDKHAEQVVDLVTSGDPQAIETMKELRRLSPRDQRWIALFGHLLSRGAVAGGETLLPPPDHAPGG